MKILVIIAVTVGICAAIAEHLYDIRMVEVETKHKAEVAANNLALKEATAALVQWEEDFMTSHQIMVEGCLLQNAIDVTIRPNGKDAPEYVQYRIHCLVAAMRSSEQPEPLFFINPQAKPEPQGEHL